MPARAPSLGAMRCPVCLDTELSPHIRSGIEIDHCPRCRGMWLDRGELEKLLDLAEARSPEPRIAPRETPATAPMERPWDAETRHGRQYDDRERYREDRYAEDRSGGDRYRESGRGGRPKRKRKSAFADMLEEVFDAF